MKLMYYHYIKEPSNVVIHFQNYFIFFIFYNIDRFCFGFYLKKTKKKKKKTEKKNKEKKKKKKGEAKLCYLSLFEYPY